MEIPDSTIMPFGKYKGVKFANIPASYFMFLYEKRRCFGELKQYIKENLEAFEKEIESEL